MPANIPNLGAIGAVGGQFKKNVFEGPAKRLQLGTKRAVRAQQMTKTAPGTPQQFPKTMSSAPPGTGPLGADSVSEGRARRQERAGYTPPTPKHAAPNFSASNVAMGHNLERGTGLQQPASTHAAPNFVSTKEASKGNPAFSSASAPETSRSANIFNSAHTNATPKFSSINQTSATPTNAPRPAINPFQVNRVVNPSPSASPSPSAPRTSLQFSDTSTKSNSPFPTHVHPAGSSSSILPNLTASQSSPGKPNEFTVGSRNIKGGGIAAMGSQLEQSAMQMRNKAKGQ